MMTKQRSAKTNKFFNLVVEQKVCLSVKGVRGAASKSMWVPYCVQWCSSKRNDLKWVEDIVLFDIDSPNCWCALYSNYPGVGFSGSYCFISTSLLKILLITPYYRMKFKINKDNSAKINSNTHYATNNNLL